MVLLGGLEFVAAGYVLNEVHKDNKKKEEKERRDRKHDRKHNHRNDSPHRTSRPSQDLRPPQSGPPRPYSAPPPGSRPMYQPQPFPGHPQQQAFQTHPQQQPHPPYPQQWQPQPQPYPPNPLPHPNSMPQQRPSMPTPPPQPRPNMYPPPGVHIDLKTGQIQHNMLPPGMQPGQTRDMPPQAQSYVSDQHNDLLRSESDFYAFDPRDTPGQHSVYGAQQNSYSQPQMGQGPVPVPSPRAGYTELDAETPGRHRVNYDDKSSPHVRLAVPGHEALYRPGQDDPRSPPPAYRE